MTSTIKLTHLSPHLVIICVCVSFDLRSLLSEFQLCNIVLLTTGTMLHVGVPSGSVVKYMLFVQVPQETRVQPLGREDPLEEATGTHFGILAGESCRQKALLATVHRVANSQT